MGNAQGEILSHNTADIQQFSADRYQFQQSAHVLQNEDIKNVKSQPGEIEIPKEANYTSSYHNSLENLNSIDIDMKEEILQLKIQNLRQMKK